MGHSDKWMEAVGVADALREYLPLLTDDERVELFHRITARYCDGCGRLAPAGCPCWNDE